MSNARRSRVLTAAAGAFGLIPVAGAQAVSRSTVTTGPDVNVEITDGRLRGGHSRGALAFKGIPYAGPVTGAGRFCEAPPVVPWTGVRDATHLGVCLRVCHIWFQSSHHVQEASTERSIGTAELDRNPDLDGIEEAKVPWHHADHRDGLAIQLERCTEHTRPATKTFLPQVVTDHRQLRSVRHVLSARVPSSDHRFDAEHGEERRRGVANRYRHGIPTTPAHRGLGIRPCRDRFKRCCVILPSEKVRRTRHIVWRRRIEMPLP